MQGHHHLAFTFIIMLGKWQIIYTNGSFLEQNFPGLILLIENYSEINALLTYSLFFYGTGSNSRLLDLR